MSIANAGMTAAGGVERVEPPSAKLTPRTTGVEPPSRAGKATRSQSTVSGDSARARGDTRGYERKNPDRDRHRLAHGWPAMACGSRICDAGVADAGPGRLGPGRW